MRILVLNAHPDPGRFCDHIADAYVAGGNVRGHAVTAVVVRDLHFDLVLRGGYTGATALEPDLVEQQRLLRWCEHLVIVSPNWWWSAPALLKVGHRSGLLTRVRDEAHRVSPWTETQHKGQTYDSPLP